eukprot:1420617-Amphidinium_carterae.1
MPLYGDQARLSAVEHCCGTIEGSTSRHSSPRLACLEPKRRPRSKWTPSSRRQAEKSAGGATAAHRDAGAQE